jgi:hypothetical protein
METTAPCPDTPTSQTGGGGAHFIFRRQQGSWPEIVAVEGIDLLTGACAFVAPGSIHMSGGCISGPPARASTTCRAEAPLSY